MNFNSRTLFCIDKEYNENVRLGKGSERYGLWIGNMWLMGICVAQIALFIAERTDFGALQIYSLVMALVTESARACSYILSKQVQETCQFWLLTFWLLTFWL